MNPDGQEGTADAQGNVVTAAQETDTKTEKSPLPVVGIVAIVLVILVVLAVDIFLLYRRKKK